MIIFLPDNGLISNTVDSLYDKNIGSDLYTQWEMFDKLLCAEELYVFRKKAKKTSITDHEIAELVGKRKAEFSVIENIMKGNKFKWIVEYDGLVDFVRNRSLPEYDVYDIPEDLITATIQWAEEFLRSHDNYEIAVSMKKLPYYYSGGDKAGLVILKKNQRNETGIGAISTNNSEEAAMLAKRFETTWNECVTDKQKVIEIIQSIQ